MNYEHLRKLTTEDGIISRCSADVPLPEHGYRVDDAARAIVVIQRDRTAPEWVREITRVSMEFLSNAQSPDGALARRRSKDGRWHGETGTGDHWGLALWAWGTVIGRSENLDHLEQAIDCFHRSAEGRTPFQRPMAFAALGAAEYLSRFPLNEVALDILSATRDRIAHRATSVWTWPETHLSSVSAVLPHALIVAGHHLGDRRALQQGLSMLAWLVEMQTQVGYLAPVGESVMNPTEVADFVDACLDAFTITSDPAWLEPARLGGMWFYGLNQCEVWMHNPQSGGGYDELRNEGRSDNQSAESTLAYLSTLVQLHQHREQIHAHRRVAGQHGLSSLDHQSLGANGTIIGAKEDRHLLSSAALPVE